MMPCSVEVWWVGLCAPPLNGAQGDNPVFVMLLMCYIYSCAITRKRFYHQSNWCS